MRCMTGSRWARARLRKITDDGACNLTDSSLREAGRAMRGDAVLAFLVATLAINAVALLVWLIVLAFRRMRSNGRQSAPDAGSSFAREN
jgi:hypothetical protein